MKEMAIQITKAVTNIELQGILELQQKNLRKNLTDQEMNDYGFVTLEYNLPFIKEITAGNHHVIAKYGHEVVGYVLLMDRSRNHLLVEGSGIFPIFNALKYKGKLMGDINYVSVGQVCVSRDHAGQGLLKRMYEYFRNEYQDQYEMAMTDIASSNSRSIKGHLKTGFEIVKQFHEPDAGELWDIVVWDWNSQ